MELVDIIGAGIVGIALVRGLILGLVREAFSLGSIAAACIVIRLYAVPVGSWMDSWISTSLGAAAPWIAGAVLAAVTVAVGGGIARLARRTVRFAGLGWADRTGGAVLGAAEGGLVVAILLVIGAAFVGRDHPTLAGTQSLAALERFETLARDNAFENLDVAAPPPW